MDEDSYVNLEWNTHSNFLRENIILLRDKHAFTDITLSCEGHLYQAHRIILSICSGYLDRTLKAIGGSSTIMLIFGIKHKTLEAILSFIYDGQITIPEKDFFDVLQAGEMLEIKELTEIKSTNISITNKDIIDKIPLKNHLTKLWATLFSQVEEGKKKSQNLTSEQYTPGAKELVSISNIDSHLNDRSSSCDEPLAKKIRAFRKRILHEEIDTDNEDNSSRQDNSSKRDSSSRQISPRESEKGDENIPTTSNTPDILNQNEDTNNTEAMSDSGSCAWPIIKEEMLQVDIDEEFFDVEDSDRFNTCDPEDPEVEEELESNVPPVAEDSGFEGWSGNDQKIYKPRLLLLKHQLNLALEEESTSSNESFQQNETVNSGSTEITGKRKKKKLFYFCPRCKQSIETESEWNVHKESCTGEKVTRCSVCFKCFLSKKVYKSHYRAVHYNAVKQKTKKTQSKGKKKRYSHQALQESLSELSNQFQMLNNRDRPSYIMDDEPYAPGDEIYSFALNENLRPTDTTTSSTNNKTDNNPLGNKSGVGDLSLDSENKLNLHPTVKIVDVNKIHKPANQPSFSNKAASKKTLKRVNQTKFKRKLKKVNKKAVKNFMESSLSKSYDIISSTDNKLKIQLRSPNSKKMINDEKTEIENLNDEKSEIETFNDEKSDTENINYERSDIEHLNYEKSDIENLNDEKSDIENLDEKSDSENLDDEKSGIENINNEETEVESLSERSEIEKTNDKKSEIESINNTSDFLGFNDNSSNELSCNKIINNSDKVDNCNNPEYLIKSTESCSKLKTLSPVKFGIVSKLSAISNDTNTSKKNESVQNEVCHSMEKDLYEFNISSEENSDSEINNDQDTMYTNTNLEHENSENDMEIEMDKEICPDLLSNNCPLNEENSVGKGPSAIINSENEVCLQSDTNIASQSSQDINFTLENSSTKEDKCEHKNNDTEQTDLQSPNSSYENISSQVIINSPIVQSSPSTSNFNLLSEGNISKSPKNNLSPINKGKSNTNECSNGLLINYGETNNDDIVMTSPIVENCKSPNINIEENLSVSSISEVCSDIFDEISDACLDSSDDSVDLEKDISMLPMSSFDEAFSNVKDLDKPLMKK